MWPGPAATDLQMQAVRTQAKQKMSFANGGPLNDTTLQVRGGLGPNPHEVIRALFCTIRIKTSLELSEVPEGQALRDGQWCICIDHDTGRPTGKVKIQLSSSQKVGVLKKVADQQVVAVGGTSLPISVTNLQIPPLPKCQGNGGGRP